MAKDWLNFAPWAASELKYGALELPLMDEYFLFSNITSTMWSNWGTAAATGCTAVVVPCDATTAAVVSVTAATAIAIRVRNMLPPGIAGDPIFRSFTRTR